MTEKPLHVRVAEALGWTRCRLESFAATDDGSWDRVAGLPTWWGVAPDGSLGIVPRFDLAWSATGPLIAWLKPYLYFNTDSGVWVATIPVFQGGARLTSGTGVDPLIAVCNLIVELARLGTLPK